MPPSQKLPCVVSKVLSHGNRVYTIELHPKNRFPKFINGQFLHLALDPYDPSNFWPESRVFSIASGNTNLESLKITYSVQGKFTTRMEKELHAGKEVWIKMPYGDFIIENSRPASLIAGGTGITAFSGLLENLPEEYHNPIVVFYGARERSLLIYKDIVEKCDQVNKNFSAFYFLEAGEHIYPQEISGKISIDQIWTRMQNPKEFNFYLSGPPAMLDKLSMDLKSQRINPDQIKIDAWG